MPEEQAGSDGPITPKRFSKRLSNRKPIKMGLSNRWFDAQTLFCGSSNGWLGPEEVFYDDAILRVVQVYSRLF
jgi:hypothetical protein